MIKKTITTDSFLDNEDLDKKEEEESVLFKVIKYVNYPIYLTSLITGRPRYFVDYLLFGVLVGTMFVLANSMSYFSTQFVSNQNLVSLLYAGVLFYPMASYFIKTSEGSNDYDFLGIFMQGVINKHLVVALAIILRGICIFWSILVLEQIPFDDNSKALISLGLRLGTYLILGAFLTWKRFAMRISNFKVFVGILITSELIKIIAENSIHYSSSEAWFSTIFVYVIVYMYNYNFCIKKLKESKRKLQREVVEDSWLKNYHDNVQPLLLEHYDARVNAFIKRV